MGRFEGKTVIVTGAGAGIGFETACAFAAAGAGVVVNSKSAAHTEKAVQAICSAGGRAVGAPGDVSAADSAQTVVRAAVSTFGGIDILVNCAGIVPQGSVTDFSEDEWDEAMRVNVKSVFLMSKFSLEIMRERGAGCIINVASVAAIKGFANRTLYAATKGALLSMTKAMAADYIRENIRVNSICPGTVLTESLQARIDTAADPVAEKKMYESRQPMGRLGTPAEIAQGILFLADDANSFMTGANLVVDGGVCI
ncbi:MAG: glucose 1-dehydrogenase [Oscillospiraceae bacterium]|nr:glucose 1-dehydrogenase [Oscillospiraceae bacterium]